MTPSERFVAELCEKSFLPFWCFSSPLGKMDKELCDVLIVCGNDIIIISVKDIKISDHNDPDVQYQRWQKAAINDSIKQIYGAERFIDLVSEITVKDKAFKIELPKKSERQIYRIAIAFGGKNLYPMETGDFGKGFVHVFDEESTFTVLNELDTITDFIYYLKTKESFLLSRTIFVPREVDFLALFIQTELVFDQTPDSLVIDHGLWEFYAKSPEYQKWLRDIKIKGTHWIDIDHIDTETKNLFKLPSKNEIFTLCCARSRSSINANDNLHFLYESLKIKVNVYENILEVMKRDTSNGTAQNISLSLSLFIFLNSLKLINNRQRFFLFSRFFYEKLDVMPSFYTYSYTSFSNKLKSFDKLGLDTFFHASRGNKNAEIVFSQEDKEEISKLYTNGIKISMREITRSINMFRISKRGAKPVSVQKVSNFIKNGGDYCRMC